MANNKISVLIDVTTREAARRLGDFRRDLADTDGAFGKLKLGGKAAFDGIKSNVAGMAAGAGAALLAWSAKAVGQFNELALAAGKFADATGLSAEEASRWMEVAADVGVEAGTVEKALIRMERAAYQTPDTFKAMGVEVAKTKDGLVDSNETFLLAIERLRAIKDPTERSAAATKLFGKSWAEMAEIINDPKLRESLAAVSDEKVIDADEVRKAREFRAAMDKLKDSAEDVALVVGESLTPILTDLADALGWVSDHWITVDDSMTKHMKETFNLSREYDFAESKLLDMIRAQTASEAAIDESREAASSLRKEFERLTSGVDALKGSLSDREAFEQFIIAQEEMKVAAIEAWTATEDGADDAMAKQEAHGQAVRNSIDATIDYIDALGGVPSARTTEIQALIDEGAYAEVQRRLTILARNLQIEVDLNARGVGGVSGTGRRASGGPVSPGQTYLVGERGPEVLHMGSSAGHITPNHQLGGMGGSTMNITINMPPGSDGRSVVEAIKQYERQHGRVFRAA